MNISLKKLKTGEKISRLFGAKEKTLRIKKLDESSLYSVKIKAFSIAHRFLNYSRSISVKPMMSPPSILFIGSGRCGTTSIADYLDGLQFNNGDRVCSRHETLFDYILPAITAGLENDIIRLYSGFRHDIEAAPHFSYIAGKLPVNKIVHIIRDGRRVVQSGINRGWYQKDDMWERIKPNFQGSLFEKCCRFWTHRVQQAELCSTRTIRLEDLACSRDELAGLLAYLEIMPTNRILPKSNPGKISSDFQKWDAEHRDMFFEICGEMMDIYYKDWQAEW
ncbi:MAG: hypothetical protein HOG03_15765 [Desulfobacula sp.]|uniref:hypothetical protein n=1 Tax=Desulfobacula sp. TaxID=2593537 RepID=UPI001DBA101E|nr:hypothetical protein [Desulfobacula sp.]MBT4026458.1 hypothetical protein [Desulfobacula sp.]MBT4200313.1 hypothetical protein [Desulfobacula sp.]MBT4508458.1 hypothetical protein [Desulfobacula sp.]MBT4874638.1 hypothetical protein [Desulfobacula sp.]